MLEFGEKGTLLHLLFNHSVVSDLITLCDLMDCSPPGSTVYGIFWARFLEWVAISSSGGNINWYSQYGDQYGYSFKTKNRVTI